MTGNKILFFCVGTGGHVLPVKYIIQDLLNKGISLEQIEIITDKRGFNYLQNEDFNTHVVDIYRSEIGKIGYVLNILKIIRTLYQINKIIDIKNTKIMFTTGSYIAPLAAYFSWRNKISLFVQEQNLYAGLGNKIASYFKCIVFTSYPNTKNLNKRNVKYAGPIINKDIKQKKSEINNEIVIGVQGGSQGSEEINKLIYKYLKNNQLKKIRLIHLVGPGNYDKSKIFENYEQFEYMNNMNEYYSKINVQISRAGGGVLEAATLKIPLLLVPYKIGTTSKHQEMNANFLVKNGFAKLCNNYDSIENEFKEIEIAGFKWFEKFSGNNFIESGNRIITSNILNEFVNEI